MGSGVRGSAWPAVPLWYGPWVPALFVLSSLSCGVAALLALLCSPLPAVPR